MKGQGGGGSGRGREPLSVTARKLLLAVLGTSPARPGFLADVSELVEAGLAVHVLDVDGDTESFGLTKAGVRLAELLEEKAMK